MAVEVDGKGPPLVMIHGLLELAGRYRVIRPDLPGSGRSSHDGALSIDGFAEAVLRLMDVMGADRAHLAGHSLGTIVCQHIAVRRPSAVVSLALFGPIHAPPDAARGALKERARKARADGMAEIADTIVQGSLAAAARSDRPEAVAFVRESLMRQPPEGYAATCEALAEVAAADLSQISCPVMLRTGDEDGIGPASGMYAMADALRGADAAVLQGCGHWATIERARETTRALGDFLARVH